MVCLPLFVIGVAAVGFEDARGCFIMSYHRLEVRYA